MARLRAFRHMILDFVTCPFRRKQTAKKILEENSTKNKFLSYLIVWKKIKEERKQIGKKKTMEFCANVKMKEKG